MKIKVACVGNMNNNMFSLVRYLRDFGIDAELLLYNREAEHFLPQCDTIDFNKPIPWIKRLSWGSIRSFFLTSPQKIRKDLENYDIIIGCGLLPAFLEKAHLKLNIFAPYGKDLYFLILKNNLFDWKLPLWLVIKYYQKKGIRNCDLSSITISNKLYKKAVEKLRVKTFSLSIPHLYYKEYCNLKPEGLKYSNFFLELRKNYEIIVFNHCRQLWKTFVDEISWKGNDIIIKGFAQYLKKAKKRAVLVLFEYGPDVENSKKLIGELGIQKNVIWLPKMPRKEIVFGLSLADFGSDILVPVTWSTTNGTSVEVMMSGKPLFKNLPITPEEHKKLMLGRPFPPIVNINSPEAIAEHLLKYENNPEPYKELDKKAKEWFDKYMGIGLAEKWVYIISCIYEKQEIDINKLKFD